VKRVLLTGGAGFFGEILKTRLLQAGVSCVSVDLQHDDTRHPQLVAVQADIRDRNTLEPLFAEYRFDGVVHCAAILAHAVKDRRFLWSCNVDATKLLASLAGQYGVPKIVFVSSNCLWADPFHRPVTEDDLPQPREIYGQSKWEGEKILLAHRDKVKPIIVRTPTIIASGRLGLLAILFEFILEGRRVWVVGRGENRYQFIYAHDLADACMRAMDGNVEGIFNVGSDSVDTLRGVYQTVIDRAGTGARVVSLPRWPTLPLMRVAHKLGLSPLGPYQYRMIAESFVFDTTKIKAALGWTPTLTNGEMLFEAFDYYRRHRDEINRRTDASAHKQAASMGVIRLLKWIS
jgi:nucleoside-diphosphate-sugar epimerase